MGQKYTFWFLTGSQDLYGEECLREVENHSRQMVEQLNQNGCLPFALVWKPVLKDSGSICHTLEEAGRDSRCAGVIAWMHTFSPAKMWISGLRLLNKPLLHLHTQFNRELPYRSIDMDFMNINQAAHGDREFGHLVSRMKLERRVIAGFWMDEAVLREAAAWMRTAVGVMESRNLRIVRLGDNMRNVAVTEGDKVEAQIRFGWEVDAYNITDAAEYVGAVSEAEVKERLEEYESLYEFQFQGRSEEEFRRHVAEQAAIEIGLERFLLEKNYGAVVTNFEMLSGLRQLPGLAVQRLMEKGYGFGAEGDWKTAGLVRLMKQMTAGMAGAKGTSFLEDYTYDWTPGREVVLESHMLEVCPTIAGERQRIQVKPLTMGDREDPARLVFAAKPGDGIAASLVDLGRRFRLIVQEVEVISQQQSMPNLPVASALWRTKPNLKTAAEAWILAGGAHHTAFTYDLTAEQLEDWAAMMGIECVVIGEDTTIRSWKKELRWNEVFFGAGG